MTAKRKKRKSPTEALEPDWDPWNRKAHYDKHGDKVARLLKKNSSEFDKWDYDDQSKQTVSRARLWFEAEHWVGNGQKDPRRSYFVDFRALWAVTNSEAKDFVSYYPMTMNKSVTPAELAELAEKPQGERMMDFDAWFEFMQAALSYRKVKIRYDARS